MRSHETKNLFLAGPAGRLEAILWTPTAGTQNEETLSAAPAEGARSAATPRTAAAMPRMAAVVCHPHPLFAGTMHNKVVYQAAKSLDAAGLPVVRFNFRGTGLSEGHHDRGEGERGDVRAALDFLAAEFPNIPLLVAGFSFGCWVGLRVGCEDARVTSLIGLGAPVNNADFSYLSRCEKTKLFVLGSNDMYGAVEKLNAVVASAAGENRVVIVEDADHFFVGKLDQVDRAITDWLSTRR
jgi:hypothetical protein